VFTGIVEDLGEVEAIEHAGDSARIFIRSAKVTEDTRPGDSIAVNGVCLTVTGLIGGPLGAGDAVPGASTGAPGAQAAATSASAAPTPSRGFTADVMGETLKRSSLAAVARGTKVNLERSVRLEDRLGGHLVQGHVDDTATIIGREPREEWEVVRISLPPGLARYVVRKGSITVDGISLTVSAVGDAAPGENPPSSPAGGSTPTAEDRDWFEVSLIPETLKRTTLGFRQPGELVNLEVDVIAKYVEKLIGGAR
jgi:riboflavin synthase